MLRSPAPVLACIDGSPESTAVAQVAAVEARRHNLPLRLVLAEACHPVRAAVFAARRPPDNGGHGTVGVLRRLREAWHWIEVVPNAPGSDLVDVLVRLSRDATLLVVGNRHLGGYDGLLGRWLSERAVTHARCPVLVVRDGAGATTAPVARRPVLAGIDGSEHSAAAMPLAVREALLRGVPLWAISVHCVRCPDGPGQGYCATTAQAGAADLIAEALDGWIEQYPQLEVIRQPMYAPDVASALVGASASASLVVVGSRGRSALTSLQLGSVSQALVQHARCPVAVGHACGDRRMSNEPVTAGWAYEQPGFGSDGVPVAARAARTT
jgi:nucleotide-binding universal stress UspA family protein